MNTTQKSKTYTGRNKDGFVCSYDCNTHKCVGVMLATGDDVELYKQKHDEYIGQLDPKFEKNNRP